MRNIPYSLALSILVLTVVYGLIPNASKSTLSNQTVAQEIAAKAELDPFADAQKSASKLPAAEPAKDAKPKKEKTVREKGLPKTSSGNEEKSSSEAVEFKLKQPDNLIFPDITLEDVVDSLSAKLEIPIIIDRNAFDEAGIGTDKTINVTLQGFRIDRFFDLICDDLALAWTVRDGYVLITTPEKLSTLLEVRVYNCSDLIEMIKKPTPALFGGGSFGGPPAGGTPSGGSTQQKSGGGFFAVQFGGAAPPAAEGTPGGSGEGLVATSDELIPDNDSLIELIQSTVDTETWSDVGGTGSIEIYHGGLLVINQNGQVHRRVEQLLEMMRQAKKAQPGTVFRER